MIFRIETALKEHLALLFLDRVKVSLNFNVFAQNSLKSSKMPVVESYLPEFLSSQPPVEGNHLTKNPLGPAPVLVLAIVATLVLVAMNYFLSSYELRGDNDATLRLVEVRDLLGGQNWFDMQQYRMGPPGGFEMHWSRLIDAPIACLILLAGFLGLSPPENFAVFTWPVLLSFASLYAALRIAFAAGGMAAAIFTLIIALPSFQILNQFAYGQIDHHNAQIALGLAFAMAVTALKPSIRSGALAGLCLALMSGIGVETQLHVVLGAFAVAMLFLLQTDKFRGFTIGFGAAFAAANISIFAGTIAPVHYLRATCDAFSIAQALPSIVGGAALAFAAYFIGPGSTVRQRVLGLILVAAASVVAALPASLGCLAEPLANIDPLVQKFWLAYIEEAKPLSTVFKEDLYIALAFTMPALIGVVASAFIAVLSPRLRLTALIIGGAVALSLAISLHQFRATTFASFMAVPLLGITAGMVFKWADGQGKNILHRLIMAGFVLICFNHTWAISTLLITETEKPVESEQSAKPTEKACSGPAFIAALNAIPKTTFMAVSNLGPDILIDTPHHVLAGPYHRNIAGIKASIQAHILPSAQSKAIMIDSGATHYVWCAGANEVDNFARENGFAKDMLAGKVPDWLELVSEAPNKDYAIYKIKP